MRISPSYCKDSSRGSVNGVIEVRNWEGLGIILSIWEKRDTELESSGSTACGRGSGLG